MSCKRRLNAPLKNGPALNVMGKRELVEQCKRFDLVCGGDNLKVPVQRLGVAGHVNDGVVALGDGGGVRIKPRSRRIDKNSGEVKAVYVDVF